MIGIIGKKVGMTQIFNEAGQQIPCTVVEATPNTVTQTTDKAVAGFASVQLGYGEQKMRRESGKKERTPRGRRANGSRSPARRRAAASRASSSAGASVVVRTRTATRSTAGPAPSDPAPIH